MATMSSSTEVASRFAVRVDEHHGGGLFELEVTTTYEVVERATGAVVMRFAGDYSASYDGVGWGDGASGGVVAVELTPAEDAVIVRFAGGSEERHPLPPDP